MVVDHDILPSYHDDPTAYARAQLDLLEAHPARVLIPSMDGSVAALRAFRSSLERHDAALALASKPGLEIAIDKLRTLITAHRLGLRTPRTVPIDHLDETRSVLSQIGYPAVIKPTRSWVDDADPATPVTAKAVLGEAYAVIYVTQLHEIGSSAVAQQLLSRSRDAVNVFYADGRVWAKLAQIAHPTTQVLGGTSAVRESVPIPPKARGGCHPPGADHRFRGYSEIESRRDHNGRPWLMEINARLSGSFEVAVRAGLDFPRLLWQWAVGEPLTPTPGYRIGLRMRSSRR